MDVENRTSLRGVIGGLANDAATLMRGEVRLARAELAQKTNRLIAGLVSLLGAMFVAYAGLVLVLLGAAQALALIIPSATALAVVGFLVLGIGVVMALAARKALQPSKLMPDRTAANVQADAQEVKEHTA